jgi:DNA-binding XRE family transcriptional regulator
MTDKTKHTPLPCPFCGKDPKVHPRTPELEGGAWGAVRCNNIECFVNPTVDDGELISDERGSEAYRQAAIKRWNVRANQDTIAELVDKNQALTWQNEALAASYGAKLTLWNLSNLGEKIIFHRTDVGLTQKQLAAAIGVAEQQIQRYEKTKYKSASLTRLTAIINALNDAALTRAKGQS